MYRAFALAIGLTILVAGAASSAEPSAKDKELLDKVAKKLTAVAEPVRGFEWPPDFKVVEHPSVNAFATFEEKDGKLQPIVRVFSGMMDKIVKGDEDILALIVGHEVAHITLRHVIFNERRDRTEFLRVTYCRDEEIEADVAGAELMLKAGFSLAKGVKYIDRMNDMGLKYSSLEGLGSDHPSWNDRLSRIDKSRSKLWKAMSAFENGVALLFVEQYALAEDCFERVVREFPDCYEAWVNLGNACLMRYFDKFDLDDIRDYGLGHVLTPGFYLRADSIATRGRDDKLWMKAVAALNKALELKKDLTLARSNLGLAYLFHPEEKDVKKALSYMHGAADDAATDPAVAPIHRATILLNLGVAYYASGDEAKGLLYVDRALEAGQIPTRGGGVAKDRALEAARNYTVAMVMSRRKSEKDQRIARSMFERYLKMTNTASIWWESAYEQYRDLSKRISAEAEPKDAFKPEVEPLRPVLSHRLKSGAEIKLTDEAADVLKRLGAGQEKSVIPGSNLKRVRYEKDGVDLLVNDSVVAICIVSPDAAPIALRGKGIGSSVSLDLRVGMTAAEVNKSLGDGEKRIFTDPNVEYTYYRSQGIGIRQIKDKVTEIVLASIPAAPRKGLGD
jgi:tetratricopeptide (TPR) repeat protein